MYIITLRHGSRLHGIVNIQSGFDNLFMIYFIAKIGQLIKICT